MQLKKQKSKQLHNQKGASLALVAFCAMLLIFCLVAVFQLIMLFGGTQELNSTADAAALNVAKRSMDVKSDLDQIDNAQIFADCTDSNGQIGLSNVNRMWGKAYLINANVEEMTADQQLTDAATNSGNLAYIAAQAINDNLSSKLQNNFTLGSFFDQIAGLRLHRMLGNVRVSSSGDSKDWPTSLAYRGDESNLAVNINQIPAPANSHFSSVSKGNANYMQGYTPIETNGKSFYFIPFHVGEMPHLVSESYFQQNRQDKQSIADISNPLPNAFSGSGKAENSMNARSFAIANPGRQYNLAIPQAFVTINISNIAYWIVQGKQVNRTTYGFAPETQWGAKHIPLGGANTGGNNSANNNATAYLDGYASLGNEYKNVNTLWAALNSFDNDPTQVLAKVTQRIQEIKPNFTQGNLQQLLQEQNLVSNVNNYVICPVYSSPDNTNPSIKIVPISQQTQKNLPGWISVNAGSEGQSKTFITQSDGQDQPNYDWEMVYGQGFQASSHWTEVGGHINWQPGTGFNQTLGRLTAVHTTYCYFTAQ